MQRLAQILKAKLVTRNTVRLVQRLYTWFREWQRYWFTIMSRKNTRDVLRQIILVNSVSESCPPILFHQNKDTFIYRRKFWGKNPRSRVRPREGRFLGRSFQSFLSLRGFDELWTLIWMSLHCAWSSDLWEML